MSSGPGYHNCQFILATKICKLLLSLSPSTYDEIAPKLRYWIEYAISEQFTTIDDLVAQVSSVVWENRGSRSDILRFLKELRDAPCHSEPMRPFVDALCLHILWWFAIAAAEDPSDGWTINSSIPNGGWSGFVRAATFVGHLIECGLLSHDLVRRHLIKPLITHRDHDNVRAKVIYELFVVAGDTLLQGLLEPGDVRVCFEMLDMLGQGVELNAARLIVRCDSLLNASYYDLTCMPATSRDPCCVVAAQGGGRKKGCRGN
jgi:hypothetical protein